jgi:hypothetical protein
MFGVLSCVKSGRMPKCKACVKVYRDKWRKNTARDLYKEGLIRWRRSENGRLAKRRKRLREEYGMTVEDYKHLLASQGDVCAICKQEEKAISNQKDSVRKLAVDHDHETGVIRGLLCINCNNGLGRFKDSAALLRAAADYLEQSTLPLFAGPKSATAS